MPSSAWRGTSSSHLGPVGLVLGDARQYILREAKDGPTAMANGPQNPFKTVRNRTLAHPDSPAGGSGPGVARVPATAGIVQDTSESPQLGSPASRYFWHVKLGGTTDDDPSFRFSCTRDEGLTARESALLEQAHTYFGLKMGAEGKIAGVLIFPDGTAQALVSGKHGGPYGGTQEGYIPRGPGSGLGRFNVTHIEGHTAAAMYRNAFQAMKNKSAKFAEAALLIPKEPCGACDPNLPSTLPRGTRLFVVDPETTTVYRSDSGIKLEGATFSRPENLHFDVPTEMVQLKALGGAAGQTAAAVGVNALVAWLGPKIEKSIIENQIKRLEPDILKALQDETDDALDLIGKKQKVYANVTVEIHTITRMEGEPGGAIFVRTSPTVLLKSVAVSNRNISRVDPERIEPHLMMEGHFTPVVFSFEVELGP
jgi:hypothetical protein